VIRGKSAPGTVLGGGGVASEYVIPFPPQATWCRPWRQKLVRTPAPMGGRAGGGAAHAHRPVGRSCPRARPHADAARSVTPTVATLAAVGLLGRRRRTRGPNDGAMAPCSVRGTFPPPCPPPLLPVVTNPLASRPFFFPHLGPPWRAPWQATRAMCRRPVGASGGEPKGAGVCLVRVGGRGGDGVSVVAIVGAAWSGAVATQPWRARHVAGGAPRLDGLQAQRRPHLLRRSSCRGQRARPWVGRAARPGVRATAPATTLLGPRSRPTAPLPPHLLPRRGTRCTEPWSYPQPSTCVVALAGRS